MNFAEAVGAQIVTSFAVSPGTRDAAGIWSPDRPAVCCHILVRSADA